MTNEVKNDSSRDIVGLINEEAVKMESEIRQMADWCHNNHTSKTLEDWEKMNGFLLRVADYVPFARYRKPASDEKGK